MTSRIAISVLFVLISATAFGSDSAGTSSRDPLSALNQAVYRGLTNILIGSVQKAAQPNHNLRRTNAVSSFDQMLGHLADAQYLFCSIALGEKNPTPKIEPATNRRAGAPATALEMMCLWTGRRSAPKAIRK